jgi:hypothetical protein
MYLRGTAFWPPPTPTHPKSVIDPFTNHQIFYLNYYSNQSLFPTNRYHITF